MVALCGVRPGVEDFLCSISCGVALRCRLRAVIEQGGVGHEADGCACVWAEFAVCLCAAVPLQAVNCLQA
jgi:hypothetical protein